MPIISANVAMGEAPQGLLDAFAAALGGAGVIAGTAPEAERYLRDWTGDYRGEALAVLRPKSVDETQAAVRIAAERRIPIVPQGGNTGLVAGGVLDGPPVGVVISTDRLNRIRNLDPANFTLQADAGVVLQVLKDAAEAEGLFFPLSLGAQGSCQVGGNVATNAGGVNVLRYGMTRDLVLGVEAVLPDGSLWNGLSGLRKDNRGYDLNQLLIGSEGTLGIITGLELKLFPKPAHVSTAYLGAASFEDAIALFAIARRVCSDLMTAFEVMGEECIAYSTIGNPATRVPLEGAWPVHVLMELGCSSAIDARALVEALLSDAFEAGLIGDGTIAESEAHRRAFWAIREDLVEGQVKCGRHIRTDISVRISDVPSLIEACRAYIAAAWPGWDPVAYGHAGDGNIHFNVIPPRGMVADAIGENGAALLAGLYVIVRELDGSFSAEHGVGRSRRAVHLEWLAPEQRRVAAAVKAAFDPHGIMNPGCLLPD